MTLTQRIKLAFRIVCSGRFERITTKVMAEGITAREMGEDEINIAQASEVAKLLPGLLRTFTPRELIEWVYSSKD